NLNMPLAVALGDLDGDGRADVAVADSPNGVQPGLARVAVFAGYDGGSFATTHVYSMGLGLAGIAIGDLNGDQANDLVVTDGIANRASVLLNTGSATFAPPTHYGAGAGATGVAIADLNGDSKLDVVTANRSAGSVTILFGAGDGSFSQEVEIPTAADCRGV